MRRTSCKLWSSDQEYLTSSYVSVFGSMSHRPDVHEMDTMVSAELLTMQQEASLRALVKIFNIHRQLQNFRGRSRSRQWRCGYVTNQIVHQFTIGGTCNRVIYRRRSREDLKVVPSNGYVTKRYRCHIDLERTQESGAVADRMKYTFKLPSTKDIWMQTMPESKLLRSQNAATKNIRSDIRVFMHTRAVGAVESYWTLYNIGCVRLTHTVQKHRTHLKGERIFLLLGSASTVPQDIGDFSFVCCSRGHKYTEVSAFWISKSSCDCTRSFHLQWGRNHVDFQEIPLFLRNMLPQ